MRPSCGGDEIKSSKMQAYLEAQNVKKLDFLLLSDFSNTTAMYANDVVKKFNPNYVVLSNNVESMDDKLERNISDGSNAVYFSDNVKMSLWDNVEITSLNFNNQSYIYLTVNDVNFLLNPSGGNAQVLPEKYRFCDVLVSNGMLENSNLILSAYGVVTADLETSSNAVKIAAQEKRFPLATAGDGNIIFDMKNNRNISIKRMI